MNALAQHRDVLTDEAHTLVVAELEALCVAQVHGIGGKLSQGVGEVGVGARTHGGGVGRSVFDDRRHTARTGHMHHGTLYHLRVVIDGVGTELVVGEQVLYEVLHPDFGLYGHKKRGVEKGKGEKGKRIRRRRRA